MAKAMKDSRIAWIGEIPEDWEIVPLKTVLDAFGRIGFRGYTTEDLVEKGDGPITLSPTNIIDSKLSLEKCSYISWEKYNESPEIMVNRDDIIFVKTASVGKCAIYESDEKATVNPQFLVLKNINCNKKFLFYCLISEVIQKPVQLSNLGSVIGTITQHNFLNYKISLPPNKIQEKIGKRLDSLCIKIDSVLEKTRKSIEEYKKLKNAVITQAVTKGIRPNRKMKDSGVEWIGEIPEEWNITKIKHVGTAKNGLTYAPTDVCDEKDGILVLRSSNIQDNKLVLDDCVYVNTEIKKELLVQENDILICSRNGSAKLIGKNALIPPKLYASFGAFMLIYRCKNPLYIRYVLSSDIFSYYLGNFLTVSVNQLTIGNFNEIQFPLPSKNEQEEIITYLANKCLQIDTLIQKKEQLIEELETYKKSLIYEYVTGKKEVI